VVRLLLILIARRKSNKLILNHPQKTSTINHISRLIKYWETTKYNQKSSKNIIIPTLQKISSNPNQKSKQKCTFHTK
jgi:hypothetical protein